MPHKCNYVMGIARPNMPSKDKICTKCGRRGHFQVVCQLAVINYVANRDEIDMEVPEQQQKENHDPEAFSEFNSANGWDTL